MKKLLLTLVTLATLALPVYAQDVSVYTHDTASADISSSERIKVRWAYNNFYVWGAYGKFNQIGKTQLMGDYKNLSAGLGIKKELPYNTTVYAESGVGYYKPDLSDRVTSEVVYYTFYDIFGQPPFQEGWWDTLEQKYEVQEFAPVINIGARTKVYKNFSVEVEYSYTDTEAYFATWSPTWNGGPNAENFDACGCYWEGFQEVSFSGWSIGINYEF
jgi:opacity protein-like surface antigen